MSAEPSASEHIDVTVVTHSAVLSGAEIALLRLARALDRRRVRLSFILFAGVRSRRSCALMALMFS